MVLNAAMTGTVILGDKMPISCGSSWSDVVPTPESRPLGRPGQRKDVVVDNDHARSGQLLVGEVGFVGDDAEDRLVVRPIAQESEHDIASLGREGGSVLPQTSSKFAGR
jgi:hypothetical protein